MKGTCFGVISNDDYDNIACTSIYWHGDWFGCHFSAVLTLINSTDSPKREPTR